MVYRFRGWRTGWFLAMFVIAIWCSCRIPPVLSGPPISPFAPSAPNLRYAWSSCLDTSQALLFRALFARLFCFLYRRICHFSILSTLACPSFRPLCSFSLSSFWFVVFVRAFFGFIWGSIRVGLGRPGMSAFAPWLSCLVWGRIFWNMSSGKRARGWM